MNPVNEVTDLPTIGKVETPKQFSQLGVVVIDGSGSMTEPTACNITKAQATNRAVRELFTRFKASRLKNNFQFAVVTFDHRVQVRLQPTQVGLDLDDNGDYDPTQGHGGGTRIYAALEEAERIAAKFLSEAPEGGVPHSVVILLMSDGLCSDPARTKQVAERIKQSSCGSSVVLACAFFGTVGKPDPSGERLLQDIATDPVKYYKTVYDAETLRGFFVASMESASGVRVG